MTSTATPNVTSSPGLADGLSQPGLPGFPPIGPSGPAPARVSRSRSPAKAPVSTIHGTCGPTSFASLPPVGPLSSWENRLRERLAMVGSTECSLIWRMKATPAGGSISRLAPWTPPTSVSDSTGSPWPTPAAADLSGGRTSPAGTSATGQRPDGTKAQVGLPNVMREASPWSTPRASDGEKGGPNQSFGAGGQPLPAQMHSASPWVTPSARDYKDSAGMTAERADGRSRVDLVPRQMIATALASGPPTTGSPATTARPAGSPNPMFPCWLMGFPLVWMLAVPQSGKSPKTR